MFKTLMQAARATLITAAMASAGAVAAQGISVSIGGALRDDNHVVWSRLVALAGGPGARFVVLATASEDPDRSAAAIVAQLQRHGAVAEHVRVAPRIEGIDLQAAVRDPQWIAKVRAARGVFFSGGAQARIVDTLLPAGQPTPLFTALRELFDQGGVVAGTSAGAAVMTQVMFREAMDVLAVMKGTAGVVHGAGLGFVKSGVMIDQHFLKRGRIGRLLPLLVAQGIPLGLGVEEDSAAIVRGDEVEVIGAKGALLIDLSQASSDVRLGAFNVRGARLSYLDHGDRVNLATRLLTPSAAKLAGRRLDATTPGGDFNRQAFYPDMLGDNTIVAAMVRLLDSSAGEVRGLSYDAAPQPGDAQPDLGFEWRLYKGPDTVGWAGSADTTLQNVILDVLPVRMARPLYTPLRRTGDSP